ncbi:unnamed protein product [Haemonchus placei]|uniref:G_PROTEIN_RECEP_F1_2 domain-containing protein n=1 Tax=Haemonchus placei TaxID=6290 RepID=A0A0N4WEL5_HAEPC|nr:unnamed protein product [Haemonchus placei]
MVRADDALMEIMTGLLTAYCALGVFGFVCNLLNIPLLVILLASRKLRREAKLIICLTIGDLINCLALTMMGFDTVPLQTSLSCASGLYIWLRTLYLCAISVFAVLLFCAIGIALAIMNSGNGYVKFDCGRKATFSLFYAQSIYYWEMLGYFFGLLMNAAAYLRAKSVITTPTVREQMKRIRYGLALGVLSTVLVSVPNVKSLFLEQLRFAGMDEWISQTFNWASIINSSFNIFVYLWLYRDFRDEFARIFRCKSVFTT